MSRLEASIIWYRARSGGELTARLNDLIRSLGAEITSEKTTIDPKQIPQLLINGLKSSDITIIIGGLELLREEENTVFILSRCLAVKLEEGEKSRSKFIFDALRGRPLPTFETAVLYPSEWGGPEGVSMTAGLKTIILLPWMERQHFDILTMMQTHLPDILVGIYGKEETPASEPEPDPADDLPYYIKNAMAKHQAAAIVPDEDFDTERLRLRLLQKQGQDAPTETNAPAPASQPPRPAPRQTYIGDDPWALDMPPVEKMPKKKPIRNQPMRQNKPIGGRGIYFFRIAAVFTLLAVIIIACYVADSDGYIAELTAVPDAYQSDLSLLYSKPGDNSVLPDYALDNFASLYAANPNTRGYIYIPDTDFAQPVVQPESGSGNIYSNLNFYNSPDARGTLYFDTANDISFGAKNSNLIIYGNSPTDGSMFAALHKYTDANYLAKHQTICMDTLYQQAQWEIFSVCIVSGNTVSEFNYANTEFVGDDSRQIHLYNLFVRSLFCTEVEVFPTDELLTLVTDSSEFTGAKLLVCARKVRSDEEINEFSHRVTANDLALMPNIWYDLHADAHAPSVPEYEVKTTQRPPITAPNYTDENGNIIYVTEYTFPNSTATSGDVAQTTTTTTTTAPRTHGVSDMRITTGGTVITAPAAEVLAMIAESEMGSDAELEALKAQCVAAYTFYLYSGGSAKAPNFPTKIAGDRCKQAADAVVGQYMTYNTNVAYTPYFPISAGKTADNSDINGAKLAYLQSVDCAVDENVSGYKTVLRVSASEVAAKVLDKKGIDLNQTPDKALWFQILERDANDLYVTSISVGGTKFRGNTLHLSILGYTCLRSPAFWIEYDALSDEFIFTSLGYGNGVGMSQSGANEYAKQGSDYRRILDHFYPGVGYSSK